jgi:Zn-finger nucleic acid-binding protein
MTSPQKPSRSEEEYFAREDAEKKRKLAMAQTKQLAGAERDALRILHQNHCPSCGQMLQEIALNEVNALRCFGCNGCFLSAEDLKKLAKEPGYWERMLHFFVRQDYGAPHA